MKPTTRHSAILSYPIASVPHCGLLSRCNLLIVPARAAFHSEYLAACAVANSRWLLGLATQTLCAFAMGNMVRCAAFWRFSQESCHGGEYGPQAFSSQQLNSCNFSQSNSCGYILRCDCSQSLSFQGGVHSSNAFVAPQ